MKFLKVVLIIILVIIAIPLIVALFVKKEYALSRFIVINRPTGQVYNYLKEIKNQDAYSKWNRMDPGMKKQYSGTDGTVGFAYAWDSEKQAGKGVQEIKSLMPNKEVTTEVRFEKPFKNSMKTNFQTDAMADNQTKVTWAINGRNSYPFNFMNLFVPTMLGNDIDSSLTMLKGNLEQQ